MSLTLAPPQKAAALLVAVGADAASSIMQYLTEQEVETLAAEIASIGRLHPDTVESVLEEVYQEAASQQLITAGGIDYARELLTSWKGSKGAEIIDRLVADLDVLPFGFVRDIDPEQLVHLLKDEHPQTIALILVYQPPSYSASVIRGFDPALQAEVALRVGTMGKTSPAVIQRVERALQSRLGNVSAAEVSVRGGVEDLAEVLNNSDRTTEKAILEKLATSDPILTEQVRALMFIFEDVVSLDDRSIQLVLQQVDTKDLAMAMKGVAANVRDTIMKNMSQRAAESLVEEIELLGPVRRSDVEVAQTAIVAAVRRLEEAGQIVISRAGEGDLVE
ncbi:MAG TPA: flagellar motor switch protein FliG [Actinobacteria bacterium]|nr:flagellar motor switch protein FliG [bacterium BMS3Bbin02]HDL41714.1 flagellar motor switch protein FliG [Actinomycetota bacterium]